METTSHTHTKEETIANTTTPENNMKTSGQPPTPHEEEKTTQRMVKWQNHNNQDPALHPIPAHRWEEEEQGGDRH